MNGKLLVLLPGLAPALRSELLKAAEKAGYQPVLCDDPVQARAEAGEAEIILSYDASLAREAKRLKWFCAASAGVNHFAGLLPEGVLLSNSSGAYGVTIAEHIVMVCLEMMRRMEDYRGIVARREWRRDLPITSIHGARIVMLGTGDIGQEAARRLRAFVPASITGVNRGGRNPEGLFDRVMTVSELDGALPEADVLIMSLPETPETIGMMDARRLELLPEGAFVINVGRGSALDQRAVERMLRAGRLAGAALDVFEREPVPREDSLWECPGLILTPHIAGNMTLPWTVERIVALFLEDLENFCQGRPLRRQVDLRVGY